MSKAEQQGEDPEPFPLPVAPSGPPGCIKHLERVTKKPTFKKIIVHLISFTRSKELRRDLSEKSVNKLTQKTPLLYEGRQFITE